jgi:hypothetical protein
VNKIEAALSKVRNKLIVSSQSVALTFYQQKDEQTRLAIAQEKQSGSMKFLNWGIIFLLTGLCGGAGTVRPSWILGLAGACWLTSRSRC